GVRQQRGAATGCRGLPVAARHGRLERCRMTCSTGVIIRHHSDGTHYARCSACGEQSRVTKHLPIVTGWADIHKRKQA
ncbi:MAG TPA: hypothetical protein VFG63_11750, partial [Nocardioidaceae bacterium]|nr:hypothetical protein [Nocardioidaceae bacterium]